MSSRASRRLRAFNLIGLTVLGLAAGYLLVAGWRQVAPAGVPARTQTVRGTTTTPPSASSSPAASATSGLSTPPRSAGSSRSVVGGLSPQELARIRAGAAVTEARSPAASTMADLAPGETPSSVAFPVAVQTAASRYRCLCGCVHDLRSCPCNDQPIGAVTMLTFLQRLLDQGLESDPTDAAMAERYGDEVLLTPPPALP